MADPLKVICGVCEDVCKRAVKATCCDAVACRNCAIKHISKNRACWETNCTKTVTTNDVSNDEELRAFIESLEDPSPINCSVCGEICKRGAILSCCKAPCCRSCGVKKVTADRKCWMEGCGKDGLDSYNLENDDILREAVVHYMSDGIMDPGHKQILIERQQQKNTFFSETTKNLLAKYSLEEEVLDSQHGGKRKCLEDGQPDEVKKAKLSQEYPVVYFELNMIHDHNQLNKPPHILQIGLSYQGSIPEKEKQSQMTFFRPIANNAVKSIKSGCTLKTFNLERVGNKLLFGGKTECKPEKESLEEALDFLQGLKSKNGRAPLTLATYRNVTISHLFLALSKYSKILGKFYNIVNGFISLENIFEEKDIVDWLPMKSLSELCYYITPDKNVEKYDGRSDILKDVFVRMAKKYKINLSDHAKPITKKCNYTNVDVSIPLEPNTYAMENSCNFDMMEPIEDLDETQKVQVSWRSLCFPIHNQPIIAELKNPEKNIKFVNLKLSSEVTEWSHQKHWTLRTKTMKVHWHQGKAYVIPSFYPGSELTYKRNSQVVQHLEDFKAGSELGEYTANCRVTACEGTSLPLLTNKPVKLIVIKTNENDNIFIGTEPTVIVVKLTNLPSNAEVTADHAFVMGSCIVGGIEIISRCFGVRSKCSIGMNKARIVVRAKASVGKWVLKDGQQIGTAALISEWIIPRVIEEAQSFEKLCLTIQEDVQELGDQKYDMNDEDEMENEEEVIPESISLEKKRDDNDTNGCSTVAWTRLYAQGSNPVLVKLQVESTDVKKFNMVSMTYSPEFKKMVNSDKTGSVPSLQSKFKCKVFWVEENTIGKKGGKSSNTVSVPYAFVNVKMGKKKANQFVDYIDLSDNFTLANYFPIDNENLDFVDISMNACVDFNVKNIVLDDEPRLVEVYLKFRENEIVKEKVLEQVFYIEECNNARVEVLTKVFQPLTGNRLAPQKISTNDMKAVLVMKAKTPGDVVPLTGRQVIAVARVASPSADLARLCAVSGGGFENLQPEPEKETYDEEFRDMSYSEAGFQSNNGYQDGYGFSSKGAYSQHGMHERPKEELNEMELYMLNMNKYDDGNSYTNSGLYRNKFGGYEESYPSNGRFYGEEENQESHGYENEYDGDYSRGEGYQESHRYENEYHGKYSKGEGYQEHCRYENDYDGEYSRGSSGYQSNFGMEKGGDDGFQAVGFQSKYSMENNSHGMAKVSRKEFSPFSSSNGKEKKSQTEMPFQEERCKICRVPLKKKTDVSSHYNGKEHMKHVRRFISSFWATPLPLAITNICSTSRCGLCGVDMNSVDIAMAHYEGKPHAKKVRFFCEQSGLDTPQRKVDVNPPLTTVCPGVSQKMVKNVNTGLSEFHDDVCNISFSANDLLGYNSHMKGPKHRKMMKLKALAP